jgi:hypothetical protein
MSWRAFFVGLGLCLFTGLFIPYSDMLIQGSKMGLWSTQSTAIFLFFLLAGVINTLLRLIHRKAALRAEELLAVFIMISIANAVPSRGVVGYIFPLLTSVIYYATAENQWLSMILKHTADWMHLSNPQAITDLYEGLAPGNTIPWGVWLKPLAAWIAFLLVLHWFLLSAAVILRRQWMDHERIPYPMVQLPLAMVEEDQSPHIIAPFFRNPLMWIGFALPFIDSNLDALHRYFPFVPQLTLFSGSISLFRGTVGFGLSLQFVAMGFSFFTSTSVGYGLCFFHGLNLVQRAVMETWGLTAKDETMGVFSQYMPSMIIHQSMGAILVLVLFGLWIGRSHLVEIWHQACSPEEGDNGEIMSYRTALAGLFGGGLFLSVWLWLGGLALWIALLFVITSLLIFIALTRAVAQGGVAAMFPPTNPSDVLISGLGPSLIGAPGLVTLGYTYIWGTDILNFAMAPMANGLRLATEINTARRRLSWGILAGIAASMLGAMWVTLYFCYSEGGLNLNAFYFQGAAKYPWDFLAKILPKMSGPNIAGWAYTGVGAAVMGLLMWLPRHFLWWPFHPLGFPISSVFGGMWFSVMLAMLIKSFVLKYGGVQFYRRVQPIFLGMILGQVVTAGLWILIDTFTGMKGNAFYHGM